MHPTDYLSEYVLGELAPQDAREIEAHLATCESCRAEVRTLRETLVTLVEHVPPATPPADAWKGIEARLGVANDAPPKVTSAQNWQPLALAASLLIALGGVLWGFQEQQSYSQIQREQRKVAGWLSRPDVAAQQLTDAAGERLGSVLTLSDGRALFILRDAPPAGSSYQAWGYSAYGDTAVDLGVTSRTLLEVPYTDYEVLEISLEPERGSAQPTQALGRVPVNEEHNYD